MCPYRFDILTVVDGLQLMMHAKTEKGTPASSIRVQAV
jgi:hypothetical protein